MAIKFAEQNIKSGLKQKQKLTTFIDLQIKNETQKKCSLQYVFVSDNDLLVMNQQFLNHDTFTDIITFDLSENDKKIIGEIYISIDRIKENAQKYSTDYILELQRVIFHGALHLCGYKDKSPKDKITMTNMENKWLLEFSKFIS